MYMGYTYTKFPPVARQTPPMARQLRGLAGVMNPSLGNLAKIGSNGLGEMSDAVKVVGTLMGLGAAVATTLFSFGVAQEAKGKLVKITGYGLAGVGALGFVFGIAAALGGAAPAAAAQSLVTQVPAGK